MTSPRLILTHDMGTTANKSCLYRLGDKLELIDSFLVEYPTYHLGAEAVEQKADEWWSSVCTATRAIVERSQVDAREIAGMAFCAQMQGTVFVDEKGEILRNPMNYIDGRATAQLERYLKTGVLKIKSMNARRLLHSLYITGGVAATAKDPIWKYHWVRDNEPETFKRIHKWLDVKDYLILRCTGEYGMTRDSAHLTFLFDTRSGRDRWHRGLCRQFDVNMAHLPPVIKGTDVVGHLLPGAACELGLVAGIPVFGGGGDASLCGLGAGCFDLYDTHVYVGTCGWVISNVDRRMVDLNNYMASIHGAIPGMYNYIAEHETSGACLKWVRDHLALDEIGVYLAAQHIAEKKQEYESLYDFLSEVIAETPAGSGDVIFTPWLHGNRSPREDPHARGMFFNLSLSTGKRQLIRAVVEGMVFHKRWMLEAMERKIPFREKLRFVGGGAKSAVSCQILADVTGRIIETVVNTQNVGTMGAAVVAAVGLGLIPSFAAAKPLIRVQRVFEPSARDRPIYDRNFAVFKELYGRNKTLFERLNHH